MPFDGYRTIDVKLDWCNAYVAPVILSAGDAGGRVLRVEVWDKAQAVDPDGLSAKLWFNDRPDSAESSGGYASMRAVDGAGTATFEVEVPQMRPGRASLCVEVSQGDAVVVSRTFEARVDRFCFDPTRPPATDAMAEFREAVEGMDETAQAGIAAAKEDFDASIAQMKAESQEELQQVSSQWDSTMSVLQDEAEQLIEDLGQVAEDHGMPLYVYSSVDEAPTDAKCAYFVYDEVCGCWALYYEDGKPEGGDA